MIRGAVIFCMTSIMAINVHSATLIVDNNLSHVGPEGTTIYRTAQEAHDAAAVGDTIMFMGSFQDYGSLTINKSLKIIGPGYQIAKNFPEKKGNLHSAKITGDTDIEVQGDFSSGLHVQGMEFDGLRVRADNYSSSPMINLDGFIFANCWFSEAVNLDTIRLNGGVTTNLDVVQLNNWVFKSCFIQRILNQSNSNDMLIANSLINSYFGLFNADLINCSMEASGDIHHGTTCFRSILAGGVSRSGVNNIVSECYVHNAGELEESNLAFSRNTSSEYPYIGVVNGGWGDKSFTLKDGIFTGTILEGKGIGAFAGSSPYRLSGLPNVPVIMDITAPPTVVKGESLQLKLEIDLGQ